MSSDAPCAFPGCCALATHGEFCAIHVDMRRESYTTKCGVCAKAIRAGTWHRYNGASRFHLSDCPTVARDERKTNHVGP